MNAPNLSFLLAGLLLIRAIYLIFRVSAYRVDRPEGDRFGVPYFGGDKYWHKSNFTPKGHPILRQLKLTAIAVWISAFIGGVLLT
jgi:hypothetical protein